MAPVRVLVVDDEESIRQFMTRALASRGYVVASASGAEEALDIAARQGPFELCVIDVLMPGMHGHELGRLLRRKDPDLKILYFTGYSDRLFDSTHTLSANEAFLEKPVSVEGLLEAVSLLLFGRIGS